MISISALLWHKPAVGDIWGRGLQFDLSAKKRKKTNDDKIRICTANHVSGSVRQQEGGQLHADNDSPVTQYVSGHVLM